MKTLRLAAAATIAVVVTLLSSGAAQAYPDGPNVAVTQATVIGGQTVKFVATTDVGTINCNWTVKFAGATASGVSSTVTGTGTSLSGSFKSHTVSKKTTYPITATCSFDDTQLGASTSAIRAVTGSNTITLLPRDSSDDNANNNDNGSDDNGALPNTGGSHLSLLIIGAALVVGGAGVTYAARRRTAR